MNHREIILYDGYCNLCSSSVQWVLRNDRKKRFSYLPLQDDRTRSLLEETGAQSREAGTQPRETGTQPREKEEPDTVVLVLNDKVFYRSAAALRIASRLRFPWPLLTVFFLVPAPVRDWVYNWVARNRKRWFGERTTCYLPPDRNISG
ncbi:MAG: DCC1-like thiol-disulfide oxidoreductase family protein [Bacteroidales bacterium]